ncbi:hypothetical protein IGI80_001431 [Enterococcus sp. DIV1420a]
MFLILWLNLKTTPFDKEPRKSALAKKEKMVR